MPQSPPIPPLTDSRSSLSRLEIILAVLLFPIWIGVHVFQAFTQGESSDEPQHLHVVWGWTHGLVQYRDIFDNHTPLFHMLFAPFFALLPERADILCWMRLPMILITLATLVCVYRLGGALFSRRVALWATLLCAFNKTLFFNSIEFRTDQLWAFFWIASLMVLLSKTLTLRRAFWAGILFGATFATSMKTSLLAVSAVIAVAIIFFCWRKKCSPLPWKRISLTAIAILAGTLVIPSLIVIYFASKGALHPLYYCVFQHNVVSGLGNWDRLRDRDFYFPIALLVTIFVVRWLILKTENHALAIRRSFIFAATLLYEYALDSYWPLVTKQDWLPSRPLIILVGVALLFFVVDWARQRWQHWRLPLLLPAIVLLAVELCIIPMRIVAEHKKCPNAIQPLSETRALLLKLVAPDEYVMDPKGFTIYRNRPFYYVLESLTRYRIHHGLTKDTIVHDLIRTRTSVLWKEEALHRLDTKTANFVRLNYLETYDDVRKIYEDIYVAGKTIVAAPSASTANGELQSAHCDILIATRYVFLDPQNHSVAVSLDGQPPTDSAFIGSGEHQIAWHGEKTLTLFFQKAWQHHLVPSHGIINHSPHKNKDRG